MKDIGYEGIFSVELMFAKGKYYFLEVNLRNDGCCWLYTVGGINYPYLWTLYGQSKLSPKTIAELNLKAPVYLMQRNDLYNLLERKLSFKQWLSDFSKTDTFFNAHFSDPLLFFYDTAIHIRQAGKKILGKLFGVKFAQAEFSSYFDEAVV